MSTAECLECGICYNSYSFSASSDSCPVTLTGCGHTICKSCCLSLDGKGCPFCATKIISKDSKPNYTLISALEMLHKTLGTKPNQSKQDNSKANEQPQQPKPPINSSSSRNSSSSAIPTPAPPPRPPTGAVPATIAAPKCDRNHVCIASDYREDGYSTGYCCNLCRLSKQGKRWFCKECHYDCCFVCHAPPPNYPARGELDPDVTTSHAVLQAPTCNNNHLCIVSGYHEDSYARGYWCNICRMNKHDERWLCEQCTYDCCFVCHAAPTLHPICNQAHSMKLCQFSEIPKGYSGSPVCDECRVNNLSNKLKYYHCNQCNYDLCLTCAYLMCL